MSTAALLITAVPVAIQIQTVTTGGIELVLLRTGKLTGYYSCSFKFADSEGNVWGEMPFIAEIPLKRDDADPSGDKLKTALDLLFADQSTLPEPVVQANQRLVASLASRFRAIAVNACAKVQAAVAPEVVGWGKGAEA